MLVDIAASLFAQQQLPIGRVCVSHYSMLRRFCVFSHDELVCKMAADPERLDISLAASTYQDMLKMVETEREQRRKLLEWVSESFVFFLNRERVLRVVLYEKIVTIDRNDRRGRPSWMRIEMHFNFYLTFLQLLHMNTVQFYSVLFLLDRDWYPLHRIVKNKGCLGVIHKLYVIILHIHQDKVYYF